MLAFSNIQSNPQGSGQVMLVVTASQNPSDSHTQFVVVADETVVAHDDDSRGATQHGVDSGIAKLVRTSCGLEFYWKGSSAAAQPCVPALERAVAK